CKKEHSIGFYADKMCVTPRYLGVAVKNTSGVTAKEWIDRAVVTTAKVMLRHSNKQVTQISDELDFPNPSFFCKFFKRMTGITPQEYRAS
ncbi:MAG: helix-turn-helix domain-containing protein, partial [Prevotella sp.]|nr:helix-turn-helix domain-containing protein [Prevotella sp.]